MLRCRVALGAAAAGVWRPAGGGALWAAPPPPPSAALATTCAVPTGRRHVHARRVDPVQLFPRSGLASPPPVWGAFADDDRTAAVAAVAASASAVAALAALGGRMAPGVHTAGARARPVAGGAAVVLPRWAQVGAPAWPRSAAVPRGLAGVLEAHAAAAAAESASSVVLVSTAAAAMGTIGRLPLRREHATTELPAEDLVASSTKKKRRAKMNKHKVRKRKKRDRKKA
ncbi:hypothetical protein MMPV_002513 [Pyropia vietnamensis]